MRVRTRWAFALTLTLASLLFVSTVTAGSYQLRRQLASQINRYLATTPMRGSGPALVAAGCRHGVDPRLLVGIAGAESTFGRGSHPSLNVWGNGPGAYMGPTWWQAAEQEARNLHHIYFNFGLTSVWRIAPKYLGHRDSGNFWGGKVAHVLGDLGASPNWLRVRC